MTVALEAAQDVKKSPRVNRAHNNKATTSHDSQSAAWYRRPTPLWGFGAAAVTLVGAFAALQWYLNIAPTPKRWSGQEKETYSKCYRNIITPTPSRLKKCFHFANKEIPQRHFDWVHPNVAVYSTAALPHPLPTLRDLSDGGQAEAIRFLEKDSLLKGKAWADLEEALNDSDPRIGEHDPFRFERVLIANVAKGLDWEPGDRMMWTRVLVQPINFAFAGYSVAETDNETQKVTSVERTDSRKFSADLSATIPGMEGPKASLGPSSEHTVKMSSDITAQYEKLGIDIMPGFLRIMRESETGGDAVGNTKVSLAAVTDPDMIRRRYPYDKTQHPSDDDPIVLLVTKTHFDGDGAEDQSAGETKPAIDVLPQVPVPHCALRARVWMLYEQRHVDSGRDSYAESKQAVTLAHEAEDKQDEDIVSADEVSPAVWSLRLCENQKCTGEDVPLLKARVQTDPRGPQKSSPWRKVVFTDYGVAIRLAHWLKTHPWGTPLNTSYQFNYPAAPVIYPAVSTERYVSLVPTKAKGDVCKGEELYARSSR